MSWIDIYGFVVCSGILLCFLLLLVKKTRPLGFSLTLFSIILFIGMKGIQYIYELEINYTEKKRHEFFLATKKNQEVSLNLTPSSWLQQRDARGTGGVIPLKFRNEIGIAFPLGSAPSVETFYCAEDDGFISYITDRFGFRNQDFLWDTLTHDILILGDSFAESACIPYEFQRNFDEDLIALSLGKGGNGPLTSLASFIEYNQRYKADSVYFLIFANDFTRKIGDDKLIDLERELKEPVLIKYLNDTGYNQGYFNGLDLQPYRRFAIDFSKKLVNSKERTRILGNISKFFFYDFIRNILLNQISKSNKQILEKNSSEFRFVDRNKIEQVYKLALDEANLTTSRLVFVHLPTKSSSCKEDVGQQFITSLLAKLGANVIDVWQEFCGGAYHANSGGHFNKKGYDKLRSILELDFQRHIK